MFSPLFIRTIRYVPPSQEDSYVFSLPMTRSLARQGTLELKAPVTFLVGENGMGKSTLLEALAVSCGFNAEGGSRNFSFSTADTHSPLHRCLRVGRGVRRPSDGFFLRAESFYNLATEVERLDKVDPLHPLLKSYGGKSLHGQSHGESFLSLVRERFGSDGLYLLDEPESALSPASQLALLARVHALAGEGSQFVIASHSPILMACPGAEIWVLNEEGITPTPYRQTSHYALTRSFLENPGRMLRYLLEEERGE